MRRLVVMRRSRRSSRPRAASARRETRRSDSPTTPRRCCRTRGPRSRGLRLGRGTMSRMRTSSTSPGCASFTATGPVQMCTPNPSPAPRPKTQASIGPAPRRSTFLASRGPAEHALCAGIARDHPFGIVGGMLRQRLDGDGVAGADLGLRRQRAAEIAPMHARRVDREMMVGARLGRRSALRPGAAVRLACVADRLVRRATAPAHPAASRAGPCCASRRDARSASCWRNSRGDNPKRWRKAAAEMRGIAKAVAIGDLRDRMMRFGRIGQVGPGALQPPLAHIMGEIVADAFEQLLQIALGDPFGLRHPRRRQLGIVEPALDGLADPVQDRGLGRAVAGIGAPARELPQRSVSSRSARLCATAVHSTSVSASSERAAASSDAGEDVGETVAARRRALRRISACR